MVHFNYINRKESHTTSRREIYSEENGFIEKWNKEEDRHIQWENNIVSFHSILFSKEGGYKLLRTEELFNRLKIAKDGSLLVNNERALIVSLCAFGTLRQDLIRNLGYERMKGFLIRYGWELGVNDAFHILKQNLSSMTEMVRKGPTLHSMRGSVGIEITHLEMDTDPSGQKTSLHMAGVWKNSYEAVEHLRRNGSTGEGVCHTLVGYVSGYLSKICNQEVFAKETSCIGKGDSQCSWVAKTSDQWDHTLHNELAYYRQTPIVEELAITYEQLLEERNHLQTAATIQKQLTKELINGANLPSIAKMIHQTTKLPIVFEDTCQQIITSAGVQDVQLKLLQQEDGVVQLNETNLNQVQQSFSDLGSHITLFDCKTHQRMTAPIFLRGRIHGYCSFLYFNEKRMDESRISFEQMMIERIADVASFYLLNKKTELETTQRVKGYFLEEMLNEKFTTKNEILQQGHLINVDLDEPYYIFVLKYETSYEKEAEYLFFLESLTEEINEFAKKKQMDFLVGQYRSNPVLFVKGKRFNEQQIEKVCWELHTHLTNTFDHVTFYFGVSLKAFDILKTKKHYEEAKQALRMTTIHSQVVTFQSLGVVGVLINNENAAALRGTAKTYLGSLYGSKDERGRELLRTLYMFIYYGGNLEQTAKNLTISISGLRYRIQRIEETLGRDLRNPITNYQIFLILQALIILGELVI